jgi:PleD family two-component response regulator
MKKKAKASGARTAKQRKGAPAAGKALVRRAAPVARPPAKRDAKAEIRRLKMQLARRKCADRGVAGGRRDRFPAGIPNRRGFERELNRSIAYIQRYQASGALIVLDVDRLKPINDNFGHAAGDEVLKAIVAVLSRQCVPPT